MLDISAKLFSFCVVNQQRKEFLRKYGDVIIKKRYLRHLGKDPIYYNGHTYGRSRRGFPHPVIYIDQYILEQFQCRLPYVFAPEIE